MVVEVWLVLMGKVEVLVEETGDDGDGRAGGPGGVFVVGGG